MATQGQPGASVTGFGQHRPVGLAAEFAGERTFATTQAF